MCPRVWTRLGCRFPAINIALANMREQDMQPLLVALPTSDGGCHPHRSGERVRWLSLTLAQSLRVQPLVGMQRLNARAESYVNLLGSQRIEGCGDVELV